MTNESIVELIHRLAELDKVASPSPWVSSNFGEGNNTFLESSIDDVLVHDERGHGHMQEDVAWLSEENATLIVEMRNALNDVISYVESAHHFFEWVSRNQSAVVEKYKIENPEFLEGKEKVSYKND